MVERLWASCFGIQYLNCHIVAHWQDKLQEKLFEEVIDQKVSRDATFPVAMSHDCGTRGR
jgi:hypothetical protein